MCNQLSIEDQWSLYQQQQEHNKLWIRESNPLERAKFLLIIVDMINVILDNPERYSYSIYTRKHHNTIRKACIYACYNRCNNSSMRKLIVQIFPLLRKMNDAMHLF